MKTDNPLITNFLSDFMKYLAIEVSSPGNRIPSLQDLSKKLGVGVASLREQLEVARALGVVEVKPKMGIKRLPYSFAPAVKQSALYALALDSDYYNYFAELRRNIETSFWYKAVGLLEEKDHIFLLDVVKRAKKKLNANPAQIPNNEHRNFHLKIFEKINNPFVIGILDTYWELYELQGKDTYVDIDYQNKVWDYHQKIAESILNGDFVSGYRAIVEHMDLYYQKVNPRPRQNFE
jgi:DNA-binding FadR family transcriptional regulator